MSARTPFPAGGFSLSAPRFCPTCGRPVPPENSFCAWCGTPMTPMAAPPPAAPTAPPAVPPAAPGAMPPPPPGAYPYGTAPPTYTLPKRADAGNLLSGTFDVWVKDFGPFFLVFLLLSLVTNGLSLAGAYLILGVPFVPGGLLSFSAPANADLLAYAAYEVLVALITWIFTSMVLGGVVDFSVRRYRGEPARITESLSRGLQRVLSIMGANLLVTVIISGVTLLWAAALLLGALSLIGTGGAAAGIAVLCGALLALPFVLFFVLYLALALSLYAPSVMMEGKHAVDSLGRSWNLTRGHKWSIFGAGLVLGILAALIGGAVGFVGVASGNPLVELVATALAAGITGAWFAILTSVAFELITKQPQASVWPATYTPQVLPPR